MALRKDYAPDVVRFDRKTFLNEVWDYLPGEHVTILAPTGNGKTHLAFQLLGITATKDLPAVVFVMKPRDETVTKFGKRYKYRMLRDWPPARLRNMVDRPAGWLLWPTESMDPEQDDVRHRRIFQKAIRSLYRKGNRIIFADETYSLEKELDLTKDLNRVWTKGRSMKTGLWAGSQRPVWISRWALQAHHLFLGNDPDVKMQERYAEIGGGIDPDAVKYVVARLQRYEFCYISRDQRTMCIVGP